MYSSNKNIIYVIGENTQGSSTGAHIAIKCANLTPHFGFEDSLAVGGVVRSMAWDPLGERLAVIFEGTVLFIQLFINGEA